MAVAALTVDEKDLCMTPQKSVKSKETELEGHDGCDLVVVVSQ